MKAIFLEHSGILIETETHQIFFDVISDVSQLIDLKKHIIFCVSHSHGDHFSKHSIKLTGESVAYVFSKDVPEEGFDHVHVIGPGESVKVLGIVFKAYASSDLGNAFSVFIDDKILFFAGDLNWWHWENNDAVTNKAEEKLFKDIVATIEERAFDIAFIPVDPRQGEYYHITGDYFIDQFDIKKFVPIHFGSNYGISKAFSEFHDNDESVIVVHRANELIATL